MKLAPPRVRDDFVPRPRLLTRLEAALRVPLTVVAAPAGFGKSTLLAQWLSAARGPDLRVAWVALDPSDNDPAHFWTYVLAALQLVRPAAGDPPMLDLLSARRSAPEAFLAMPLRQLGDVPGTLALVLDDYHVIEHEPIHRGLAYLLDHVPVQVHLVVASRADPPLPLARLRARDQLVEVRAADLRFVEAEVAAFLTRVMRLELTADQVARLEARTEGWVAGLQLAGLALRGQADPGAYVERFSGSHRYVVDYLLDDVLHDQPAEVQLFLQDTVILDRLSGPVCDALTGRQDGQAMLESLDRRNLFVVPLDEQRRWYRYHQLFADALRHRLRTVTPDREPELHRRAAAWMEQNGFRHDAITHMLAAGDAQQAARLIEQMVLTMLSRWGISTLRSWLEALPNEEIAARPWLCFAHAWVLLFAGRIEAAQARLDQVDVVLAPPRRQSLTARDAGMLEGHAAALRTWVAFQQRDIDNTIELGRQALERVLPEDHLVRGAVGLAVGQAHAYRGDVGSARVELSEAARLGRAAGDASVALYAMAALGTVEAVAGHLRRAAESYGAAIDYAAEHGSPAVVSAAEVGMGTLLLEWYELDAAVRRLRVGVEVAACAGIEEIVADGCTSLAFALEAQGDRGEARDVMQRALDAARCCEKSVLARTTANAARLNIVQRDLDAARRWADGSGLRADDQASDEREVEYLALAVVLLARGRAERDQSLAQAALPLLERLGGRATDGGRGRRVIEVLALEAAARDALGQRSAAVGLVERALVLAEPEGYVYTFAEHGPTLAGLLATLAGRQTTAPVASQAYVARLVDAIAGGQTAAPPERRHRGPGVASPLTAREEEVADLLAQGLTNRQIAQQLVVTERTVAAHVEHILDKLGFASRTQVGVWAARRTTADSDAG